MTDQIYLPGAPPGIGDWFGAGRRGVLNADVDAGTRACAASAICLRLFVHSARAVIGLLPTTVKMPWEKTAWTAILASVSAFTTDDGLSDARPP